MPRPSQRGNDPVDPLFPNTDLRGPGPLASGQAGHLERGTIISVDAGGHVYRVALNSGRTMQMSRIRSHPGDLALLPVKTIVVVTWALGLPYILGVLPREVSSETSEVPQAVTDVPGHGGDDPALNGNLAAIARAPQEPRDLMPGDFVGLSPDGASVAALNGQVAQIRGGPLAKVQAFGDNDMVRIVAGVLDVITWMGEAKVVNNGGKTSYIWRGGTDQVTQTGPDEQKYTIKLDVGHTGDVIRLEVCNRAQQVMFRFHVSAAGACEIYAAGGLNQHGGGSARDVNPTRIHGSRETDVTGASVERVAGNSTHACQGSHRRDVVGNDTRNIGGGQSIYVTSDHSLQVGGNSQEDIAGTKTISSGSGITQEVLQDGDYAVNTTSGNAVFTPATGKFQVRTAQPDAIEFGVDPTSHAVKFEELQSAMVGFQRQLDSLFAIIKTHTHVVVTAPPAPPTAIASPSLVSGLSAPLSLDLSSARSRTTKTS